MPTLELNKTTSNSIPLPQTIAMQKQDNLSLFPPLLLQPIPPSPPHPIYHQPSPPIKIQIPTPNKQQNQITPNKRTQNPKIPPPIIKRNPQRLVELVADRVGAVRAVRGAVVGDVAGAAGGEEGRHVVAAGLAGRGGEAIEFDGFADDGLAVEFVGDEGPDEAGESRGVWLVH